MSAQFGADRYIWQMHSSNDDRVHSATLRSSATYEMLGCVVYREATRQFSFFPPKIGDFDECQVDKSGRWLVIKENVDGAGRRGQSSSSTSRRAPRRVFLDQDGAAGHSDNGYGYMVAADNWNSLPGADPRVGVRTRLAARARRRGCSCTGRTDWAQRDRPRVPRQRAARRAARPAVRVRQRRQPLERAARQRDRVLSASIGSLRVLVVAPVMTDLDARGGGADDYAKLPKGNLDVTGQYFIWTSNAGGNRLDAFVVKVPARAPRHHRPMGWTRRPGPNLNGGGPPAQPLGARRRHGHRARHDHQCRTPAPARTAASRRPRPFPGRSCSRSPMPDE